MVLTLRSVEKIISYCEKNNYNLATNKGEINIVYVEGMDANGEVNSDLPNQFNDVRIVLDCWLRTLGCWSATTEPGRWYTEQPMNPKGAARIAFGQYRAWRVGMHGSGADRHEALVQVAPVKVFRDANKDMIRTGDAIDEGLFGVNQHWGYDMPPSNIGKASAGCLVGRSRTGHREFMNIVKTDPRYFADKNFIFSTIIIPGDKL